MAVAPTLNTVTNKPIVDQAKSYYFLINRVTPVAEGIKADDFLIGKEILESMEEVLSVIPKYLPLQESCELCIYTCDERYIKHWRADENPTIEDITALLKF